MTKAEKARRATAYHEAGHVVMCVFHHINFELVSIKPTEFWNGIVLRPGFKKEDADRFDTSIDYETAIREIMISMSGQIAESIHRGQVPETGHESDMHYVGDFLSKLIDDEEEQELFIAWLHHNQKRLSNRDGNLWKRLPVRCWRMTLCHKWTCSTCY